jgi:hypothetical protein
MKKKLLFIFFFSIIILIINSSKQYKITELKEIKNGYEGELTLTSEISDKIAKEKDFFKRFQHN